jgi:hypothetical protein
VPVQLDIVFDAFDEICRRMKEEKDKKEEGIRKILEKQEKSNAQ